MIFKINSSPEQELSKVLRHKYEEQWDLKETGTSQFPNPSKQKGPLMDASQDSQLKHFY